MGTQPNDPKPAPGQYPAKIDGYGIKKTKAGDPAPTIRFLVKDASGASQPVYWQGSFNGGGRDITVKALLVCGLKDPRALAQMAQGVSSGVLDTAKEVNIVVAHETAQNDPTKRFARVQWINEPGAAGNFAGAIDSKEAGVLFGNMGLEADFLRIAGDHGYKLGQGRATPAASGGTAPPPTDLDIPF